MRAHFTIFTRLVLILLFFSCEENKIDTNGAFAIYFLNNDTLKMEDIIDKGLDELQLSSESWISNEDILYYDWSSHCIYLKKDKASIIPEWAIDKEYNLLPEEWADKPFVITANDEKCYLGYFSRVELSMVMWIAPMIGDIGLNSMYPQDVLFIDWGWLYRDYPQNNSDVKNVLIDTGLYHGGISVTFDTTDVNTIRMVNNADTSTISYIFTITNNDKDALYIIDPDKTGSDLFHWFTNGITFQNIDTEIIYEPRWRAHIELPSTDYWSPDWFTKLESGHSIQRTVMLKGYQYFPTGEYIFEFRYSGPVGGMEKESRERLDGRYWIGSTRSNILVWNYQANSDSLTGNNSTISRCTYYINDYINITQNQ